MLAAVLCTAAAPCAHAADWPQWRGPARDGMAPGVQLPPDWLGDEPERRWRVPLGDGYAAPVVAEDRVYTFGREGGSEVVQAHELQTGRVRWRFAYPAPYEVQEIARVHGAGPKATPLVAGGQLYTLGVSEIVHCLDTATGRVRWRIDFPRRYGTSPPGYGACSSPILVGERLVVPASGRVMAVNIRTGGVAWQALDEPFYASLITAELAGRTQIVAFARYRLAGLEPSSGALLWSRSVPSLYGSNVATPAVWQGRVVASAPAHGTRAFEIVESDGRMSVRTLWQTRALRCYMSSPVLRGGYLYGIDESGQLVCLDARDGRTTWARGNFGDYASLVIAGDQLLVLGDSGDLTAIAATPASYRELGTQQVADSPTWTHLVLAAGSMFVRDKKGLSCYALPEARP